MLDVRLLQAVVNLTVVYQGDNPDTNTVTVYDTVTVDTTGGTSLGDQFAFLRFYLWSWEKRSGEWTIESDQISESTVQAIYFQRNSIDIDDMEGYNWMEFDAWADLFTPSIQTQPSYEVSDGQIVISDPDDVITSGAIGIMLGS